MPATPPAIATSTRAPAEFDLIERHLAHLGATRADVVLGVGDDAALLSPPSRARLRTAIGSGAPGPGESAAPLAWRVMSQALDRLAARGARPAWATLALTMPSADETRIADLSRALDAAAREAGVAIVGGDTTSGPERITVCVIGVVATSLP